MENKVIYITGATRGIGLGVAKILLKEGYKVAISGRKEETVQAAIEELKTHSDQVFGVVSDVKDFESEQKAIEAIITRFDKLDVVIANAGLGIFKPVDELSIEEWKDMIDTNLNGVFYTMKASLKALKETQGYFISIASLAGTNFFEAGTGYNASKYGVVGFSHAAMLDLRRHGISVSTLMPGSVSSHFNGHNPSGDDHWKIQPEDVGELISDVLKLNRRMLPSRIEIRPMRPDLKTKK